MNINFAIGLVVLLVILTAIKLAKCGCGCWKFCSCVAAGNCCCSAESFTGGTVVTLHFAPWCGYCKQIRPTWDAVKNKLSGSGIVFRENDEDKKPTPGVNGYPTIIATVGGTAYRYAGDRTYEGLYKWVQNPTQA